MKTSAQPNAAPSVDMPAVRHGRHYKVSLYMAMMAIGAGQTLVFAILPMLGRALQLDELVFRLPFSSWHYQPRELAITLLSAMTAFSFSLAAPKWGQLSDRLGRRKSIILVGLFGHTAGSLIFCSVAWIGLLGWLGGVSLYLLLIVSRTLHSAIFSAAHPNISAYMVDVTSVAERTKGIVKLQTFNQLGVMLGPILAWFVHINFLAPLLIHAVITLFVAILLWYLLPDLSVPGREESMAGSVTSSLPVVKTSYFDPRYRQLLLTAFLLFSMVSLVQQTLGFYFQDRLNLDGVRAAQYFSLSMVVSSIAMLIAQFSVVRFFKRLPMQLVVIGVPVLVAAFAVLGLAKSLPMLMLGMALFGGAMGLNGAGLNTSATLLVRADEQGSLAGMVGSVIGLGFVSGPLLGGVLYGIADYAPFLFACVVCMPLWLQVIFVEKKLRVLCKREGH